MTEDLAAILGIPTPVVEKRQCMTITLAAAVEWRQRARRPTPEEVHRRAQEMREDQTRMALEAAEVMGNPEEMVAPVEHELKAYAHDFTVHSHKKDFRSLSIFPLHQVEEARLVVLRADYKGGLVIEAVQDARWQPEGWDIVALIWKGHITLLQPPDNFD